MHYRMLCRTWWPHDFSTILDVGANIGQFALGVRERWPQSKIISIEPGEKAFKILSKRAAVDPNWTALQTALGDEVGLIILNEYEYSVASSTLPVSNSHAEHIRDVGSARQIKVPLKTLDGSIDIEQLRSPVLLKIDVQGSELSVLRGAENVLRNISIILLELSIIPLYKEQPLFDQIYSFLRAHGFYLLDIVDVSRSIVDRRLLQCDALFARE